MPHNFIKMAPSTSNPGRWNRGRVQEIAARHDGVLEHLWFDDPANPTAAFALVRDGDPDKLMADLQGQSLTRLHEAD